MMRKESLISIALIILGFVFEYLYLGTETMFFTIKFWLLGIICIIAGTIGLILFSFLPLRDQRAEKLGKYKKASLKGEEEPLQ